MLFVARFRVLKKKVAPAMGGQNNIMPKNLS